MQLPNTPSSSIDSVLFLCSLPIISFVLIQALGATNAPPIILLYSSGFFIYKSLKLHQQGLSWQRIGAVLLLGVALIVIIIAWVFWSGQ